MSTSGLHVPPAARSLLERLAFEVARRLSRLPARVLYALAGGEPVRRDECTLDPALQLMLAHDPRAKSWIDDLLRARAEEDRAAISVRGPLPSVGQVRDLEVSGAEGALAARHYVSGEAGGALLVYFHGGGFVFGNLETHDVGCRLLCKHGGFDVLAVAYRLVPEHRFPAAVLDAEAAFGWAVRHAAELGANPSRIGVGGDSAGANLAAVVSLLTRSAPCRPACQLLISPPTDRTREHPSVNSLAEGFLLTKASIDRFFACYALAVGADAHDPRLSPLLAPDLGGLPPTLVVTAGFDPLRDEGEAYAAALQAAGTPTELRRFGGLIHGFFNLTGIHEPSREAVVAIASATRRLLDAARPSAAFETWAAPGSAATSATAACSSR
jgi:acetyl esterase